MPRRKPLPVIQTHRDLTILRLSRESMLLLSCDSCGGVGDKPDDVVQVPAEIVGYYTCRVAVLEVLAAGADVEVVIDTLSVEWDPTGRSIFDGIKRFLAEAGLDATAKNGSTEENFPVRQTGMGITVLGRTQSNRLQIGRSRAGDQLVVLGLPKVGGELVHPVDPDIASIDGFYALRGHTGVFDVLPVGSRGVAYEAMVLSQDCDLGLEFRTDHDISLEKSAGPATCVLAAVAPEAVPELIEAVRPTPLTVIGALTASRIS